MKIGHLVIDDSIDLEKWVEDHFTADEVHAFVNYCVAALDAAPATMRDLVYARWRAPRPQNKKRRATLILHSSKVYVQWHQDPGRVPANVMGLTPGEESDLKPEIAHKLDEWRAAPGWREEVWEDSFIHFTFVDQKPPWQTTHRGLLRKNPKYRVHSDSGVYEYDTSDRMQALNRHWEQHPHEDNAQVEYVKPHDNIAHAVVAIAANERDYALTASAIRTIVYGATGRDPQRAKDGGWTVGFGRQVGVLWAPVPGKNVHGHYVYRLTEDGRARLDEAFTVAASPDVYDALAWLPEVERFRWANLKDGHPGYEDAPHWYMVEVEHAAREYLRRVVDDWSDPGALLDDLVQGVLRTPNISIGGQFVRYNDHGGWEHVTYDDQDRIAGDVMALAARFKKEKRRRR